MGVDVGAVRISCPYGTIGTVTEFGIGNQDVERLRPNVRGPNPMDICFVNDFNRACVPDGAGIAGGIAAAIGKTEYML